MEKSDSSRYLGNPLSGTSRATRKTGKPVTNDKVEVDGITRSK
jgi:hypothetical protein